MLMKMTCARCGKIDEDCCCPWDSRGWDDDYSDPPSKPVVPALILACIAVAIVAALSLPLALWLAR